MGNMLSMHTLPTAELTGASKARTVMFRSAARHDGSASKYELKPRSVGAFFCRQACGVVYSRGSTRPSVKLTVLCSDDCWSCRRNNEIDLQSSELGGELGEALNASLRPAMRRRSADRSARPPRPQAADRCFFC